MSGKTDPFVQDIICYHSEGNYKAVLNLIQEVFAASSTDKSKTHLLHLICWPTPTEKDLQRLASVIYSLRASHIHSIGCGTGLLEWLLSKFLLKHYLESETDYDRRIEVTGIEGDFRWWTSSYAPPQFITLQFFGKDFATENPFGDFEDMAMFCYCNSVPLFQKHVKAFLGTYVLIIGPLASSNCDLISDKEDFDEDFSGVELPENFKLPKTNWKLILLRRFGLSKTDHVAIYRRIEEMLVQSPTKHRYR